MAAPSRVVIGQQFAVPLTFHKPKTGWVAVYGADYGGPNGAPFFTARPDDPRWAHYASESITGLSTFTDMLNGSVVVTAPSTSGNFQLAVIVPADGGTLSVSILSVARASTLVRTMPPDNDNPLLALGGDIPVASGAHWRSIAHIEMLPAVYLDLYLPKEVFLAGEAVSPRIRVANHSDAPLVLMEPRATVRTDTQLPFHFVPGSWPVSRPGPRVFKLPPGETWTWSNAVQLPFADSGAELPVARLRALVQSPWPGAVDGNSAAWPVCFTPLAALTLQRPQPSQDLRVHFEADRERFSVRVTDAIGAGVDAELLVASLLAYGRGKTLSGLLERSDSTWSGSWRSHLASHGGAIQALVWVAGPGYVTALGDYEVAAVP